MAGWGAPWPAVARSPPAMGMAVGFPSPHRPPLCSQRTPGPTSASSLEAASFRPRLTSKATVAAQRVLVPRARRLSVAALGPLDTGHTTVAAPLLGKCMWASAGGGAVHRPFTSKTASSPLAPTERGLPWPPRREGERVSRRFPPRAFPNNVPPKGRARPLANRADNGMRGPTSSAARAG